MKRFLALLAVSVASLALGINAAPQTLPVLYDSSIKTPAPSAPSSDIARVYKELLRVGGMQLKNQCFDGKLPTAPKLSGLARGAFTRKGAVQVAWLLELCYTKRYTENGFYGLVIVENGQFVRVSSIQLTMIYATTKELYSLRDINLNGTDELALVWNWGDAGEFENHLALLEQTPKGMSTLGQLLVYRYIDAELNDNADIDDWKVFVLKGKPPVFVAISKSGKPSPVKLSLDKPQLELQTFLAR